MRFSRGCARAVGWSGAALKFHRVPQSSARIPHGLHKTPQGSIRVPDMFCKVPWLALEGSSESCARRLKSPSEQ